MPFFSGGKRRFFAFMERKRIDKRKLLGDAFMERERISKRKLLGDNKGCFFVWAWKRKGAARIRPERRRKQKHSSLTPAFLFLSNLRMIICGKKEAFPMSGRKEVCSLYMLFL